MIGIYLCDDEPAARQRIQAALEQEILVENLDMELACSVGQPQSLLAALEEAGGRRGIYFLDVELKDEAYDGFLLGQEIRRLDPHAVLVYITGYGDLVYRTFQYHLEAFDYIVKEPEGLEQSVAACLRAIQARLEAEYRAPRAVLTLRTGDLVRNVPLEDILFFETAPVSHHILLHTLHSRMDFLGDLNTLEKQLGERFLRIHRAYLVAVGKIERVDLRQGKLWVGGQECLLSRRGKGLLRKIMERGSFARTIQEGS